jgi:hypothetical protein
MSSVKGSERSRFFTRLGRFALWVASRALGGRWIKGGIFKLANVLLEGQDRTSLGRYAVAISKIKLLNPL